MTEVRGSKKESVSLDVLKDKLPCSCYDAVLKSFNQDSSSSRLDESIYTRYFNAAPPKPLTIDEQNELFENLGNQFVKNHYSTEVLRTFLDTEPQGKKIRQDE
jgi:hypothetical protein